jgi:broad specificity phosphatase PhoE
MSTVFFITHPDVAIDSSIAVADWPLNDRGRERMRATTARPWARELRRIFASSERKARDGAEILAAALGLAGYSTEPAPGENDRSATGYLAKPEFEATADAFFANPHTGVRGWERAVDAQARIVGAVDRILSQAPDEDDWRSSAMAAAEPCSIATSRDWISIAVMTSLLRMAETGLPLTA